MFGKDSNFVFTKQMLNDIATWNLHGAYQTIMWNHFSTLLQGRR
jgi:hypothetical protein